MPIIQAIVLGITQGLSEFLPISSSGHLILVRWLFGWDELQPESVAKAFDVALHLGTLVAVVAYFWRDLIVYVREGVLLVVNRRRPTTTEGRLAWLLVLSAVPAGIVGALFESVIDEHLGTPFFIAISLIVFGLVLGWADRLPGERPAEGYRTADALAVGAAQVLALNPGTSRSGITMTHSPCMFKGMKHLPQNSTPPTGASSELCRSADPKNDARRLVTPNTGDRYNIINQHNSDSRSGRVTATAAVCGATCTDC